MLAFYVGGEMESCHLDFWSKVGNIGGAKGSVDQ